MNLVDNAIRHNEPGGWVRVTTETDDKIVRLVVENGGARASTRPALMSLGNRFTGPSTALRPIAARASAFRLS